MAGSADAQTQPYPPPAQPYPQPAQPGYGQPPPAPASGMEAGGLAPPGPLPPDDDGLPPVTDTEYELDEGAEEDSGRGLTWFWVDVEGGFQHVGLQTFNVDEENFTAGFVETSQSGGMLGLGFGPQFFILRVGPRARIGFFSAWQLFSVGGELGLRIPAGIFEPHFELGGGYAGLGSVEGAVTGAADAVDIRGFYARAGGGLDIFATPVFSIGAKLSWEFMGLTRPGVSPDQIEQIKANAASDAEQAQADALAVEGSGYGSALSIAAVLGLSF